MEKDVKKIYTLTILDIASFWGVCYRYYKDCISEI